MTTVSTLLLITADPSQPTAWHAYRYAKTYLETQVYTDENKQNTLSIFFYADAANTANKLRWQTADRNNLTTKWVQLSQKYQQILPVCVSTALTRGITDQDNATRHKLDSNNVAEGFKLVGLGDLSEQLSLADKVIQF